MRTRRATPLRAAELLVLLLPCFGLVEPSGRSGSDSFTIVNENTGKCITPLNDWIVAKDCDETKDMLWKWVSQHRLFHLQSQKCLGLDITKPVDSLRMFSCDSNAMLWWKCEHRFLYGAAQYRLTLKGGHVIASTNSSDVWKKGGSEEKLCAQPYHEIYTRDGNSYGRPCEFPFLVNGTWHHECLHDGDRSGPWCATTLNYEYDQKWGICLQPENGCEDNWEKKEEMGSCYQFNTQATLPWKKAYVSCQNQGADLLSINSAAELTYLTEKEGIPRIFWIGLNQLYSARGWEWSDHKPLNFLNWDPDVPSAPIIDRSSCARMDANSGLWQSFSCEAQLPYVCKKLLNNTVELTDVWTYSDTRCDAADWLPNNGFCYLLVNESDSWDKAHMKCKTFSSDLISIHSLADVELIVTKLHNGDAKEGIWTGLRNINTPTLFQWSDGTEVTLTYWDENEPHVPYNKTPNCVSYLGKLGQWKVQSCEEKLKYVCKKKGEKLNDTRSDKMCPPDEGWKRHGEACYKIYKDEVPFGTNCNLTVTSRFEQEYLNDMIKKYTKSPEKYFWTGLRDTDASGEYSWGSAGGIKRAVTYSNWNFLEPASPGGCVAMATGKSLGKWEVKDCRSFRALSICKKISEPPEPKEAAPKPEDPCPEGWHSFPSGLSCYKLFHIERIVRKRNWEEAERFCQALGGHLPSFSHMDEIKKFLHFLTDQFSDQRWLWIGLNKRSPDLQGSWQWSDHTPVSTIITANEFQQDYDIRDCAAVKVINRPWRRRWYFYDDREFIYLRPFACDTKLEWMCQIPKGCTPKIPDWYNPERAGIHGPPVVIEGSEYWFVADPRLNYEEAVLYCASNHSSLASLTSFAGLRAIKNKIANISGDEEKWWVRTTDQLIERHFIYSRHPLHHFPITFGEECFYLSAKTWFSDLNKPADCRTKLPFVCEKYNVSSLEKYSPDSAAKIQCSGDWITFQNKCFLRIKPKSLTFSEASDACQTYGGTLPSVLSQREQDFITSLLPDMEATLWIGLRWTAYEKINKWMDNRELTYSNFHPLLVGRRLRIPTNIFDEELSYHCALMLNLQKSPFTGTWNFTSCSEHHTLSLCQKYSEIESRQTLQNTSETMKYQNNLYKIILKTLTWTDALKECQKENMQLVSITDPYEQAFLTVQAVLHNSSLWIGLSSHDDELNFGWSDGKHLQFSRWAENNEQLEDCVVLDTDGFWKTSDCDNNQPGAICYFSGNETEKEVKPVNSVQCPSPVLNTPWIPFQNSCYNFMITKNRYIVTTQDEVHSKCQTLNPKSYILSIRDEKENNFVLEQLLHYNYMASWVMLGITYENNSLMWSDKTTLSYTHWRSGRPAVKNGKFFAGLNTDGFWDIQTFNVVEDILYFHQHSILACKIEMVDYKEDYNSTLPRFIPHKDGIYNVIQKRVTWYEALNTCSQSGGHLASVHDQNGQLFLEDIVKRDGFPLWVGLSSHDGSESSFEWSDGSAFDYIPWKDKKSAGNCVVLDPKGIWKHEKCNSVKDGAICFKPTKSKEVSSHTYSSRCPAVKGNESQWIQYRDHCYTSDQALHSFSEARRFCSELDHSATIVTIKDEDENKFVSRLMRENNNITMRVWLGLSQLSADQSWNWLDGSKVTFVKWANKFKSGSGQCSILLASNETWIKVECSRGYGRVVCTVPLDCPSSTWVQFQDSCYIFLQEAIKVESIEDVRNQCTDHGADMISIHNEEENAFILDTLQKQWKGPDDILLGMFFDTDDASFKWFDKSNMTFVKWSDQEDGEDLVDTCAFLHTKTGDWKKGNCEVSSVEGTLCKAAIPYEKKYLSDNHILISALVIASTVILTVLGAVVWFLYKRSLDSGFTTVFSAAPQSPYNDDCVLVIAEENEYDVQFD
ncbi:lymphocyte antigen 75 isoform X3 [Mesoplodon densirostris]|uniref:lymphocyte antigen 75 isoform X3 n=1 Tax=Mesoplodon densirostris TaxID=48708 RepID=UPI0028DB51CC|nr:lymphocyte antigen 75 isoform X3 [Mesoplodon densirostris]